ncbi:MAG: tRNA 2-thiouridine(34) synthase MnmA, partial [Verrucomicrobia bacterium]|nr:tRNA 2-thiouridine(34) synthase MnmA [Cytophagales bacterium]
TITKVRYKDRGTAALVEQNGDEITVLFHEPVNGIAPGQAAVFYEGDDVIGGGWITKSFRQSWENTSNPVFSEKQLV